MRCVDLTSYRGHGAGSGYGIWTGFDGERVGVGTGVDYVVLDTHLDDAVVVM